METQITIKNIFLIGLMSFFFITNAKAQGYGYNTNQDNGLNEKYIGCDSVIYQDWNGKAWVTNEIDGIRLTADGLLSEGRIYDSVGKYAGDVVVTRDANNRATALIIYDNTTGTPVKQQETDFEYNSDGWVVQQISLHQSENDKNIYTYDGSGRMIVNIYSYVDPADSSNRGGSIDSFFYNSSNLMVKDNSYAWDGTTYKLNTVYTETYNPNGKIASQNESGSGQYAYFQNYSYNAAGNEILELDGHTYNGKTYYDGKDTLTYDTKGVLSFTTSYGTDTSGRIWHLDERYGCASAFSGIASIKNKLSFNIYPNPSRGNINIQYAGDEDETANIKIVNMQGKELYNKQIQFSAYSPITIESASIPDGLYVITAANNKGTYNQKLVVSK